MFQASFVQNVTVGGQTVVPPGDCDWKIGGIASGWADFWAGLNGNGADIIVINGQSYAVQTNSATQAAKDGALGKTAMHTAAGAAIGAAAGNAGEGAAIGASTTLLRRSEGVSTPAGRCCSCDRGADDDLGNRIRTAGLRFWRGIGRATPSEVSTTRWMVPSGL